MKLQKYDFRRDTNLDKRNLLSNASMHGSNGHTTFSYIFYLVLYLSKLGSMDENFFLFYSLTNPRLDYQPMRY